MRAARWTVLAAAAGALLWLELPRTAGGPALPWRQDLETALADGQARARPAVVRFDAGWCSICDRFERRTLRDPDVANALRRFERVLVDATQQDAEVQALMDRFGVFGVPALVFVTERGQVLESPRVAGFEEASAVREMLDAVSPPEGNPLRSRP